MVFYFTSSSVNSSTYTIYMGKDKYENEDLIKYGWPEDIWFHVDKISSAHVYLRLHKGEKIEDIPKEVLVDCAQLVKANSIQGCKMNNVSVVYTPWSNLKKTADMDVGQIGFHRQKDVKIVTVEKKVNEILNRLEKTKLERFPDLAAEKEGRDREERNEKKAQIQEMKRREKEEMKKKKEMDELRSYSSLMKAENMSSNQRLSGKRGAHVSLSPVTISNSTSVKMVTISSQCTRALRELLLNMAEEEPGVHIFGTHLSSKLSTLVMVTGSALQPHEIGNCSLPLACADLAPLTQGFLQGVGNQRGERTAHFRNPCRFLQFSNLQQHLIKPIHQHETETEVVLEFAQTAGRARDLLHMTQREEERSEVNPAVVDYETHESTPKLAKLLKLLLWAQNELDQKKVNYPRVTELSKDVIQEPK
ncbi:Coiled-coil domain-containing protein 25 [Fukomys damarensis]|uniref:Coiled-coil domain-containing protein 25 n=1 Tax=Fukomys damarensis TaxID=885580 RepID=A0A091E5S7_FUKDA|nr:Coiled-coil domain-containing protein 25 [Fukomys damarensis]